MKEKGGVWNALGGKGVGRCGNLDRRPGPERIMVRAESAPPSETARNYLSDTCPLWDSLT